MHSAEDAFRFFVSPYHPDTLRVPSAGPVIDAGDRLRHALTWNVFRTLEQIAPSFWMRPLIARMGGLVDDYGSAPHVCRVKCWQALKPAPWAMLRRARRASVRVDVVISTDDTVVTFVVPTLAEVTTTILSDTAEGGLLDVMEATCCLAGVRSAYTGVVLPLGADNDVWIGRVNRRAQGVHRVLRASVRHVGNARSIGAIGWSGLMGILEDAAESKLLHSSERRLAERTARWMSGRLMQRESSGRLA